ncbi:MAG: nucleoside deaminase [Alphaproteobacteria bacterium]|nr:nucleoside deaminase [Alphaproteobacteria bacterium]
MTHKDFLDMAIAASNDSVESGSSPFGAAVVKDNNVISVAHNTVVPDSDPTAHAEINAIRMACKKLNTFDLTGCVLYTSCYPCPMCMSAIKWANITVVYYAANKQDADNIGFRDKRMYDNDIQIQLNHIENNTATDIMSKWFKSKNKKRY